MVMAMRMTRRGVLGAGAGLASVGMMRGASAQGGASSGADMDTLVRAAKAEGEFIFYCAATENVAKRISEGFEKKYGIRSKFVRLGSGPLQQRYAAEAQAGVIAADVILSAGDSSAFAAEGLKGGWIVPVTQAGIGAMKDGSFPASFLRGASAVVQIQPWVLTYNTDRLTGADVPKDWPDILKPRFAGQIIYSDPIISDAYLDHWVLMLDLYGLEFFAKLKALTPRKYVEGVAAAQALAAGEGIIQFPVTPPQIPDVKRRGAPLEIVMPATATGVEIQLIVSNPAKAKHPACGRLFADWLCSREGNAVLNADPGIAGVYDASALPKNYVPAKAGIVARKDEIRRLLGFIA